MKRRIPLFISVLLILVLTACASADEVKLTASDGAAGDWFGYSVSTSGDYAIVGAHCDDDSGDYSGSAYIFKRDGTTWSQQTKITASDGADEDLFGQSVSISGDYVIVGARWDDDSGDYSGSAYIFKRDGTTWSQQTKITASDGAAGDRFGYSVSISGDYVIVGALGADDSSASSGSVYIFKLDGTTWSQQTKIAASDGAAGDRFGQSVSISGDYVIVGAYCDDDHGDYSGSAYIYKRNGTTWSQQTKITASDGAAGDRFGCSTSVSGNCVIVGAHCDGDDDRGDYSGSAYIFKRDGTTWSQQTKITASDGAAGDRFGQSVSISGDYVIVGAYCDDDDGENSGSAYIFKRDGTTWSQQTKITASDGAAGDRFGCSTSVSGNCVIVGAHCDGDDDRGDYSGSAYIFKRDGTTWSQQTKITASDGAAGDRFGQSVSISGDYVIVGAYCDDDDGENSGSAHIYDIQTTEPPITGDLNDDDLLTPADAVIALRMAAGCCEPTTAADVSSDGAVNSLDALMILLRCFQ